MRTATGPKLAAFSGTGAGALTTGSSPPGCFSAARGLAVCDAPASAAASFFEPPVLVPPSLLVPLVLFEATDDFVSGFGFGGLAAGFSATGSGVGVVVSGVVAAGVVVCAPLARLTLASAAVLAADESVGD